MSKEKVQIKCSFSVHYTLEMELEEGEDFRDKICGLGIFTQYGQMPDAHGLDYHVLREQGVTVVESDWDGDPSPTGRGYYRRDWEVETVEDED